MSKRPFSALQGRLFASPDAPARAARGPAATGPASTTAAPPREGMAAQPPHEGMAAHRPQQSRAGTSAPAPRRTRTRRLARWLAQRVAVLVALLILFYATSLHGLSARTLVLAVVLILCLYWLFKDIF